VRQPTFADGMQVLITNLGAEAVSNLPTVRDTYMAGLHKCTHSSKAPAWCQATRLKECES
jgi:hypothetical protein